MDNRVVITGAGIYSCIGKNLEEVRESLYKGKSGIILEKSRKDYGYRSALTGFVETPDLKQLLSRRERIGMHQPAMYAFMSTKEALENAKLDVDFLEKNETGIIFGNDSTAGAVTETVDRAKLKKDNTLIGSGD